MAEVFYILCVERPPVGNCALWWRPDGKGYTCNLDEAGLYTREEAFDGRARDVPVPRETAERLVIRHVRLDHLRQNMEIPRG